MTSQIKPPRFFYNLDISSSLAFHEYQGRGECSLGSLFRQVKLILIAHIRRKKPLKVPSKKVVFIPLHQSKFDEMEPFFERVKEESLVILFPSTHSRITFFNQRMINSHSATIYFESFFPIAMWFHLFLNLNYWLKIYFHLGHRQLLKRMLFYIQLYGQIRGFEQVLAKSKAKFLFTANEDSPYASTLSQLCRIKGVKNINFMHGNCYLQDQFYDISYVFGSYQKKFLEENTKSETCFEIIGSPKIKQKISQSNYSQASHLLYLDQKSTADKSLTLFSSETNLHIAEMLSSLLNKNTALRLALKLPPTGSDEIIQKNMSSLPFAVYDGNKACEDLFPAFGMALTPSSTAGLQAIVNGLPTIFLNPGKALNFGPVVYMQEFTVGNSGDLIELINNLMESKATYENYWQHQINHLSHYYDLEQKDYELLGKSMGLLQ